MTEMIKAVVLLIIGFVLLIKGADFFVDGSSSVAKILRVPTLIIGLTVVAMGTSLPELAVSFTASISGNNALAVSNAVGSNIFNLMVVCGLCALFAPLAISKKTLTQEFPMSIACAALLLVFGYLGMEIGIIDGLILVALFIAYIIWMIISAQKSRKENVFNEEDDEIKTIPVWKCILFIVGGIVAIAFGGDFVVQGASTIAAGFGLSQTLIGLTIVALGTSLPELVTSVVAARKNELDMALGNVIGSNIFNILLILGVSSSISPIAVITDNLIDIIILIAMSLFVLLFSWTKKRVTRVEGIIMLLMYATYMVYICIR